MAAAGVSDGKSSPESSRGPLQVTRLCRRSRRLGLASLRTTARTWSDTTNRCWVHVGRRDPAKAPTEDGAACGLPRTPSRADRSSSTSASRTGTPRCCLHSGGRANGGQAESYAAPGEGHRGPGAHRGLHRRPRRAVLRPGLRVRLLPARRPARRRTAPGPAWGKVALLFGLLWLPWQQLTWAANAVSGNGRAVRLIFLVATAASVPMAGATSTALGDGGPVFAVTLGVIMVLGFLTQTLSVDRGSTFQRGRVVRWVTPERRRARRARGRRVRRRAGTDRPLAPEPRHRARRDDRRRARRVDRPLGPLRRAPRADRDHRPRRGHRRHRPAGGRRRSRRARASPAARWWRSSPRARSPALLWWAYFDRPGPALEHRAERHRRATRAGPLRAGRLHVGPRPDRRRHHPRGRGPRGDHAAPHRRRRPRLPDHAPRRPRAGRARHRRRHLAGVPALRPRAHRSPPCASSRCFCWAGRSTASCCS